MRSAFWLSSARSVVLMVLLVGMILSPVSLLAAPEFGVVAQEVEPEPEDEDGTATVGRFCDTASGYLHTIDGFQHPMGARLAGRFDVDYATVMNWFCQKGMGFGQIMLALITADRLDGDTDGVVEPDTMLQRRSSGEGWGQIWQDLGLIGAGRRGPAAEAEGDEADGPETSGRPDFAGPPAHAGPKSGDADDGEGPGGPPSHAGPPDHAGNPHRNQP